MFFECAIPQENKPKSRIRCTF